MLGTARILCELANYLNDYLAFAQFVRPSWRLSVLFLQENTPLVLLGATWPLIIGLIVRRTGSLLYLRAAVVTFL